MSVLTATHVQVQQLMVVPLIGTTDPEEGWSEDVEERGPQGLVH